MSRERLTHLFGAHGRKSVQESINSLLSDLHDKGENQMHCLLPELYEQTFQYLHGNDYLNLNLVCSWNNTPKLKLYLGNAIEVVRRQVFTNRYGEIAESEKNIPINPIRLRIDKILNLMAVNSRIEIRKTKGLIYTKELVDTYCIVPYRDPIGHPSDMLSLNYDEDNSELLQLNFDKDSNSSLVKLEEIKLTTSDEKYTFYLGFHLDKTYRVVEAIFEEHAKIAQELNVLLKITDNLAQTDNPPQDLLKQRLELLRNICRRLVTIEMEQSILLAGIKSSQGIYANFCASLSKFESTSFYYSYFKQSFQVTGFNPIPLPLDSNTCQRQVTAVQLKIKCGPPCPKPCPPKPHLQPECY